MSFERIGAIDATRGLAVVLAMLSHALVQFGDEIHHIKLLTRTATPAFMILFGAMIEIVYLRKLREAGTDANRRAGVVERLLSRMLTCYVVFGLVALAALVSGKLDIVETAKAMLFLDQGRFGNILRIYTVLFAFVILTLPLAARYGAVFFVWAALGAWMLKYAFGALGAPDWSPLQNVVGHVNGYGPAMLPGLTFIAFGMLVGEALTGRRSLRAAALVAAVAGVALAAQLAAVGPRALADLVVWDYRWTNDPRYFAFGIVSTSAILGVFWLLWRRPLPDRISRTLAAFGRDTLFIYGFGNVALNLLPTYHGGPLAAGALALCFLAVLLCLSLERLDARATFNRLALRLPETVSRGYARVLAWALPPLAASLTYTPPAAAGSVSRG